MPTAPARLLGRTPDVCNPAGAWRLAYLPCQRSTARYRFLHVGDCVLPDEAQERLVHVKAGAGERLGMDGDLEVHAAAFSSRSVTDRTGSLVVDDDRPVAGVHQQVDEAFGMRPPMSARSA